MDYSKKHFENIIKLKFGVKEDYIEPNPCWEGYEAIGTKIDENGREVPNCVPIKEEQSKVKEGFPIPSPEGEEEDKYISRCISAIIDEYPEEGQAYAVCKSKWDER
jgi:hypothetical protein